MGDQEPLRDWLGYMSRKYPAARSPGVAPDDDDASAREDPTGRELVTEARAIYQQCQDEYDDLRVAGLPAGELRDFRDRINSVFGRLGRMEGQPELRRAITDLRNVLRDLQDRGRQIPAGGYDHVDVVDDIEYREQEPASSEPGSSAREVFQELQQIHGRIQRAYAALRGRIPDDELEGFHQRNDALVDVLHARPSNNEVRRAVTDAHDLLNDLAMRLREVRARGGSDLESPGSGAPAGDGPGLYRQAQERFRRLSELIPDQPTEIENYRRQVDSLWGRFRHGNRAEAERCLVDLRGIIQDIDRRIREETQRRRSAR